MRLGVQLVWEGVLAVVTVVLAVLIVLAARPELIGTAFAQAGAIGLIATGFALSLRTGTPNLAVGPIAAATGAVAAYLAGGYGWPQPIAMVTAVVVALILGIGLGGFVAAVSVPAWAASVVTALICEALIGALSDAIPRTFLGPPAFPTALWFVLFAVISLGGGLLWLLPRLRDTLSTARTDTDPGRWAGLGASAGALVGLTGSTVLAGLGGLAQLSRLGVAVPAVDWSATGMALAAALLGGVSAYGRRAGIAGTLLGVLILAMLQVLLAYNGAPSWLSLLLTALVAAVGLGVTRVLESLR